MVFLASQQGVDINEGITEMAHSHSFFGRQNLGANYNREHRVHAVLSDAQLVARAPSIFAETKHDSRSERYVHIPTFDVIAGMRKEGFLPVHVQQARARTEDKKDHTKHILRFRHESQLDDVRGGTDDWRKKEWYEVILINSHDGSSGYVMTGGWFRFACLNGMVFGDKSCEVRVRHSGRDCMQKVVEGAYTVLGYKERVAESRELMRATVLDAAEQEAYAAAMTGIRYAAQIEEGKAPPVEPSRVLTVHRAEDDGAQLWQVFNRAQENLTQGGLRTTDRKRRTYTRGVTGMADHLVNQAMWLFTHQVAKHKQQAA